MSFSDENYPNDVCIMSIEQCNIDNDMAFLLTATGIKLLDIH